VFEKSRRGIFQSELRLIFLGRLLVLPVLFVGAAGYFVYLAGHDRLRSIVFSELRHIVSSAGLDSTYRIEDWFMKKGRLIVQVTRRAERIKTQLDSPLRERAASWLKRLHFRFR
jgi:hypothetical protein